MVYPHHARTDFPAANAKTAASKTKPVMMQHMATDMPSENTARSAEEIMPLPYWSAPMSAVAEPVISSGALESAAACTDLRNDLYQRGHPRRVAWYNHGTVHCDSLRHPRAVCPRCRQRHGDSDCDGGCSALSVDGGRGCWRCHSNDGTATCGCAWDCACRRVSHGRRRISRLARHLCGRSHPSSVRRIGCALLRRSPQPYPHRHTKSTEIIEFFRLPQISYHLIIDNKIQSR